MSDPVILVYGASGWIGQLVVEELQKQGLKYVIGKSRIENKEGVTADVEEVKPTHVINAAGATGRPNVDWCESHKADCIRSNILGPINVADICKDRNIHLTQFGSGCIYHYDETFPEGSGKGFSESDKPNFTASFYSHCKAIAEDMLLPYDNVLILRVRMPIVADLEYPRNFIAKIIHYKKVIDIPNSMTMLPELVPMAIEMAKRKLSGPMNFTNPGVVSHNGILALYKEYIDPEFTWENFTVEEQAAAKVGPRSNNELDASRLKSEFPGLLNIKESLIKYVFEPNAVNKDAIKAAVDAKRGK